MSGDLYLEYITSDELDAMITGKAILSKKIQHADKYQATAFVLLTGRLNDSNSAKPTFNRAGLPPHMYIEIDKNFASTDPCIRDLLERTFQPASIIAKTNDFKDWESKNAQEKYDWLIVLTKNRAVTLEIYFFKPAKDVHEKLVDTKGDLVDELNEYFGWSPDMVAEKVHVPASQPSAASSSGSKGKQNAATGATKAKKK